MVESIKGLTYMIITNISDQDITVLDKQLLPFFEQYGSDYELQFLTEHYTSSFGMFIILRELFDVYLLPRFFLPTQNVFVVFDC